MMMENTIKIRASNGDFTEINDISSQAEKRARDVLAKIKRRVRDESFSGL